ncbi:FAD-binding oxidoreductase [Ferrimonas marina]|uniref:FAD/FMN-containing dehydrogenase n=1 Tax=Ferrimonas marina TaxID=299255 RepID=A0A1M5QVC6_9GAMM|nr:FAD-binding oxidoreductase [Ferrimonas marina]SHH18052.1 FAD/FMN-containing dehydrogenase [Ferrimonas marina]
MPSCSDYRAWGLIPDRDQRALRNLDPKQLEQHRGKVLPFGRGRSYGDSCLNSDGALLDTRDCDHLMAFDAERGLLRCESGVTFEELVRLFLPKGWFLPVTPGTMEITLGGAIANDIHGKNHHGGGTFGCYLTQIALWRSDEGVVICSPDNRTELFNATIGGLGLTGLILWAEFQMKAVPGNAIEVETHPFQTLQEFVELSEQANDKFEYTVAWLDCFSAQNGQCKGLFYQGNHSEKPLKDIASGWRPSIPFNLPGWLLNRWSISAFNALYYWQGQRKRHQLQHCIPFFYPLDGIRNWNRLYGKRGFYQYQCVLPLTELDKMQSLLEQLAAAGTGSFLGVLKLFSDHPSPGQLSFPQPGICLALDIPNRGEKTRTLLDRLDQQLLAAGGRLYPAKDARMSASAFHHFYPQAKDFAKHCDPKFQSDFWARVNREPTP